MTKFSEWKKRNQFKRAEFSRRYRRYTRYYMVYVALIGTGILSGLTGILLPFTQENSGINTFVAGLAGLYFCIGFLTNGEVAANYWFGKLTDHDPDNNKQQIIAGVSLGISVIVSLITSLASSLLIAFWLGIFPTFNGVPDWAQVWIVDIIPVMWIYHAVAGMTFKALSEEAQMERITKSFIREKENELVEKKEEAKVQWWAENAQSVYEEEGRKEARLSLEQRFPSRSYASESDSAIPNQQGRNG